MSTDLIRRFQKKKEFNWFIIYFCYIMFLFYCIFVSFPFIHKLLFPFHLFYFSFFSFSIYQTLRFHHCWDRFIFHLISFHFISSHLISFYLISQTHTHNLINNFLLFHDFILSLFISYPPSPFSFPCFFLPFFPLFNHSLCPLIPLKKNKNFQFILMYIQANVQSYPLSAARIYIPQSDVMRLVWVCDCADLFGFFFLFY